MQSQRRAATGTDYVDDFVALGEALFERLSGFANAVSTANAEGAPDDLTEPAMASARSLGVKIIAYTRPVFGFGFLYDALQCAP